MFLRDGGSVFSGIVADFDTHVRSGLLREDEEGPDGFPGGRPGREPGVHVLLGAGCGGEVMGPPEPVEELDGFGDLLLGGVHRALGRFVRRCHGADAPEVVPLGEMLDGFGDLGGQGAELGIDPGFEAAQIGVLIGEEPVMDEYCPEVVGCPPRRFPVTVETFVGQGSLSASNGRQERLDLRGAFPGDDAFRSIGLAEDIDHAVYSCRIRRIREQQGGEVVPECAAAQMPRR